MGDRFQVIGRWGIRLYAALWLRALRKKHHHARIFLPFIYASLPLKHVGGVPPLGGSQLQRQSFFGSLSWHAPVDFVTNTMTQTYEMLYIIPQDVTEENVPAITAKVDELLQRSGAKITREEPWGRRKFSYAIENQKFGTYQLVYFELPSENLPALEKELQLRQEILRFLIVKYRVRTAKEIAEHEALVAKIAEVKRRRDAIEAKEAKVESAATPQKMEEPAGPVDTAELEKRIDELLDESISDQ